MDLAPFAAFARLVGAAPLEDAAPAPDPAPDADLIDRYEERAAIMEYDGGMTRVEAEAAAWRDIFGERPKPPNT